MKFPTRENDILGLAEEMKIGLTGSSVFPSPPVSTASLTSMITAYTNAQHNLDDLRASAIAATAAKIEALDALTAAMKKDLSYAEYTCDYDDTTLRSIGWGARKEPTPMPPPGVATDLTANPQEINSVILSWAAPLDGGTVATYKVQRRKRPDSLWDDVGAAMERSINLLNQPRGVELEYRVIAVNKAGESAPSNTVVVVL